MKKEIMEKVLNDQVLTQEEVVFLAKNLKDGESDNVPYDHDSENPAQACGVSEKDVDEINGKFAKEILNKDLKGSQVIEKLEIMALANPKFLRLMIIQCAQYAKMMHIKKSMAGGLGDILDEIKRKLDKNQEEEE